MNLQLQTEVRRHQLVRERIIEEFPGTDDETIRDTLEGITDLHEMIAAVIRSALWTRRSLPFGKYWRSRPLVFSLLGRCHGLAFWQKNTGISSVLAT